jgi:L-fucose mutarotase/ribose pyranase (RbsD/FucU family)
MSSRQLVALASCLIVLCCHVSRAQEVVPTTRPPDWTEVLSARLPQYGHRNWIAIVDSAYPAQTTPGLEMVRVNGADHLAAVRMVLRLLANYKHVRPVIYLDAELPHVAEADAPGIDRYRADLAEALKGHSPKLLPHGEIIDRLDAAGEKFRVLVLKTNLALPYTSVFIELDCGYWSPEAEQRLRDAMGAEAK